MGEISISQAAEMLRVPKETVLRWVRQGVIPTLPRRGGFDREMLLNWAHSQGLNCASCTQQKELNGVGSLEQAVRYGGVFYQLPGSSVAGVLKAAVKQLPVPSWDKRMRQEFLRGLQVRERYGATVVAEGVALPHASPWRNWEVSESLVGVFFLQHPVQFAAELPAVRMMLIPVCNQVSELLVLLKELSDLLADEQGRKCLLKEMPPQPQVLLRQIHDVVGRRVT